MVGGNVGWGHVASYSVDGDYSTFTQSDAHVPWDLVIDLGSLKDFNTVEFTPDWGNYATQYDIQVSANGSTYSTVAVENNGNAKTKTYSFRNVNARYVKINVRADSGYNHAIRDVKVYNMQNLALGKTASMLEGNIGWDHYASYSTDGNVNTYTQSDAHVPWDLLVDLGGAEEIDTVVFTPDSGCYATQYEIQVSLDGVNFASVATEGYGTGTEKAYRFGTVKARYVKISVSADAGFNHTIREVWIN
jgi:hypothetical protein